MPPAFTAFRAVRGRPRRALLAALLAVSAAAAGLGAAGREVVRLDLGRRQAIVPAIVAGGVRYASLKSIAAALGARIAAEGGTFRLETAEGRALVFPSDLPGLARAGSVVLSLGRDAIRRDGDLFVPEQAVPRLLAALEPERQPGGSGWSLAGGGDGRLTLEARLDRPPERVDVRRRPDGDWEVAVAAGGPVEPPWRRREIGGRLLAAIEAARDPAGLRIVLRAGPDLERVEGERRSAPPGFVLTMLGAAAKVTPVAATAPAGPVRRVVLDPGHGGAEDGAVGPGGVKEKDLVLDIARRLRELLRAEGFEVLLTRDGDIDLGLDERAAIANRWHADLFVSLHANASRAASARGAETYFLSAEATDDAARTLAALENNAVAAAGAGNAAGGSDELPLILWDMAQREYLQESARLARTIQRRLNRLLGIADRGVRRAPFRVLVGATCPAVLVELGFVTNPEEEARLADPAYRSRLAEALRDAIRTFGARAEERAGDAP
ncbi:MAG: N-acetylmuramoyl-L-alanine amidase [Acidobacteria bacterium]|nr:MAG: N-acetylmuramoyl-L-alanine amidase [Acidobacteriota bacterium]